MPLGKIKNNGNFIVSFHKVSVDALLTINVVCFIFRLKRGADFRLSSKSLWQNPIAITTQYPTLG